MNELKVFENPAFGQVRTVTIDGEPWFVGKDVAIALGYKNPQEAIRNHVDGEDKGVSEILTPGGKQKVPVINESGLYSLILSSKLPTAKEFKRWVTSEVLPAIRKTGTYTNPRQAQKEALQEKRLQIMEMNAKSRLAKQMTNLWNAAGVEPQYQALALNDYFEGLSLPRVALKETAVNLLDKTTIAKHLGIMAKSGSPHAQAVGAIIGKLTLTDEEQTLTPYSRNGHDGEDVQYTPSVEKKVKVWLEEHQYPTTVAGGSKNYTIVYQKKS